MKIEDFPKNKNLWIYGIGRPQKDFQYIFDDMEIEGYIFDDNLIHNWYDKPVCSLKEFKDKVFNKNIGIIICDFDKLNISRNLDVSGFVYQEDYFYAEDIFKLLDYPFNEIANERDLVIWGTGRYAESFLKDNKNQINIKFFIDNDIEKKNKILQSRFIKHPDELTKENWKSIYVIVASSYYFSIKKDLEKHGLQENRDFIYYEIVTSRSERLKETYYDRSFYSLECNSMFNHLDLGPKGNVHNCCATFLKSTIGNLLMQDMKQIWNSNIHKIFCLSVLNKTFTYCKKELCPLLINKKRLEYVENYEEEIYKKPEMNPKVVNIAMDPSCNLYCKTCRNQIDIVKDDDYEEVELLSNKIINQVLPYTKFVMMAGNGEVFLSKSYEKIWSSAKSKTCDYFQVLSNGTLFTQSKWDKLMKDRMSNILFCISIDAATEGTYKKIRRGGNWEILMKNMEFAAELRRQNKIKYFRINFVIQRENYREIPDFIRLGQQLSVDRILFTKMLNWGTYTNEEFEKVSMVDEEGKPKIELQKILDSAICQNPIVDIGTLKGRHTYQEAGKVENYFLWEIDNYSTLKLTDNVFELHR